MVFQGEANFNAPLFVKMDQILDQRYRDLAAAIVIQALSDFAKDAEDVLSFLSGDWSRNLIVSLDDEGLDQVQEQQAWQWLRERIINQDFSTRNGWLRISRQELSYDSQDDS